MPQSVPEFQALLTGLANELGVRIDRLTPVIGRLSQQELLSFITDAYPQLATPFLAAAGDLTATWYGEQPAGAKGAQFIPEPADLAPVEQLAASGRWAMLQPEPVNALKRTATRAVFQTSTDTVAANAKRENVKWARHASANACGFCRLMATRGAVYNSQAAAGGKYHDGCHCIAVPDRDGTYEPAPYVKQWDQDYVQAQDEGARTPGQIANAMDRIARDRRGAKTPVPVDPLPNVRRTDGRDLTADIAAINPNWKAGRQWQINCTRCAAAIELRARRYDVTAEPKLESVRDNGYASVLSRWLSPDGTPAGQGAGLHATRSSVPADETLGMSTGSRIWDFLPAKGRGNNNLAKRAADTAVAAWGPGARGFITVEWSKKAGGGAHIFNVENRDGEIVYLDGQSNQIDAAAHWDLIKTTGNSCRIVRTDDLTPTERVMEWTRERTDTDDQLARNKAARMAKLTESSGARSGPTGAPAGGGSVDRSQVRTGLKQHELDTASRLALRGHSVVFIPHTGIGRTADTTIDGETWEFKSISGASEDAIARNLRAAVKQAENAVLDVTDSALTDEQVKVLVNHYGRRYNLQQVRVIRGEQDLDWRWRNDDRGQ